MPSISPSRKRTRILFLLESATDPSGRLRVMSFLPYIDPDKYEWEVRAIPNSILSRPALFQAIAGADIVFLHRKLFRPWEMPFISGRRGLIYDFDDMVMLPGREKYQTAQGQDSGRLRRFRKTITAARAIIAGNTYLREQTGAAADKTVIIPTTVDTSQQPVKLDPGPREGVVLGWIGTRGNLRYLASLAEVLQRLSTRVRGLTLKIICDGFIDLEGVRIIKKKWQLDDEPTDLFTMDIGLMPLPDDLWTRGKCGYKILQYMAAGLPVVASPVGVNANIVRHGVNGFWASTQEEWADGLVKLVENPDLREQMGRAGRALVQNEYDLKIWVNTFLRVLDQAAGYSE